MTMTNYKQLCAELVDAIDSGIPTERMYSSPLVLRARASLAEPDLSSLKEQALEALDEADCMAEHSPPEGITTDQVGTIRRALEQLDG